MKSYRAEIERLTPQIRQVARALVENGRSDVADDLVHDAVGDAVRGDHGGTAEDLQHRLYVRLVGANRLRLRSVVAERYSAPGAGGSAKADGRQAHQTSHGGGYGESYTGLDALPLADREALVLVVLARLDYGQVADLLGIPMATLVTRLARARDTLAGSLWAGTPARPATSALSGPRRVAGHHLRLVKS